MGFATQADKGYNVGFRLEKTLLLLLQKAISLHSLLSFYWDGKTAGFTKASCASAQVLSHTTKALRNSKPLSRLEWKMNNEPCRRMTEIMRKWIFLAANVGEEIKIIQRKSGKYHLSYVQVCLSLYDYAAYMTVMLSLCIYHWIYAWTVLKIFFSFESSGPLFYNKPRNELAFGMGLILKCFIGF